MTMSDLNDFVLLEQIFRQAALFHEQGNLNQAETAYKNVLTTFFSSQLKPNQEEKSYTNLLLSTLNNLAVLYIQDAKYEEAVALTQEVLKFEPDATLAPETLHSTLHIEAHSNLSLALSILGRSEEARQAIEAAIRLAPKRIDLYASLVKLKQFAEGDIHLANMEALAQQITALSGEEQMRLHFALGKALADLGRHEQSFGHLLAGNAIKRRQIVYDEEKVLRSFDRTRAVFTPRLMQDNLGLGHRSPVPVFIVGMVRSGTTLVEQILASHPKVFGAGEVAHFEDAVAQLRGSPGTPLGLPGEVPVVVGTQLRQLGAAYIERIGAGMSAAQRITDKMTQNFRFAGLIHLALPGARIIHCRRDPIDTCLSCFSLLFAGDHLYSYDLSELGRFYCGYARLMEHWRSVLPEGVMLEVDYEDLVTDFEQHARRIIAYCDLEWDDACLAFYKTQRPVRTASMIQVRQPVYRSSVGRWRPYERMLGPLLQALEAAPSSDSA